MQLHAKKGIAIEMVNRSVITIIEDRLGLKEGGAAEDYRRRHVEELTVQQNKTQTKWVEESQNGMSTKTQFNSL